jgi:membrane-associated phospholipid phosphatase
MDFLRDPSAAGAAQSIGAFASLHCSIFFTAAVATHLLGLGRYVKIGVWILFALTAVATIYFGWHYVLDDIAGVVIAVTALALARAIVGIDLRNARQRLPVPAPAAA